ncbi:MAG: hypothetical protein Ct9H300mP1_10780 [Planctomycetaceae bacterium]|nr:MAG: hypothetical protein Ct9H300mP1_10780 [Planctomycetaceae bacterium]
MGQSCWPWWESKCWCPKPLARQLAGVRRNLIRVEKDMADLVGARDAIWETSDLLAGIQDQSDRLDATEPRSRQTRGFREQVENAQPDSTRHVVCGAVVRLQDRIVDESADHQAAMTALNRLVQLRDVAVTGVERKRPCRDPGDPAQGFADDLDQAHGKIEQLVDPRDAILRGGQDTDEARATLDQLVLLQDSLNTHASDVAVAKKNLSTLLALGESLRTRSNDIASAVESVEVLADLKRDIHEHVQSLSGMRRELMEVVLLQSTVARVVRILGPLSELADLRRLSPRESPGLRHGRSPGSEHPNNQQAQRVIGQPTNASPRQAVRTAAFRPPARRASLTVTTHSAWTVSSPHRPRRGLSHPRVESIKGDSRQPAGRSERLQAA